MTELKLEGVELNEYSLLKINEDGKEKIFHLNRDDTIIPDFYAQLTPNNPSIKLEDGIYVNGRIDAAAGKKEIPIIPSTNIQRIKADNYFWSEVEVAPAQMVYEGGFNIAEPCDVKAGKFFLSQSGIEQGTLAESISDLANTVWVIKTEINTADLLDSGMTKNYDLSFFCEKEEFEHLYLENNRSYGPVLKYGNGNRISKYVTAFSNKWNNESLRTIEIKGGQDTTNKYLIAWLQDNAIRL